MPILFGIGVGPGDKELLTVKAVNAIKRCSVIVAPAAKEDNGYSIAYETAKDYIDKESTVYLKHFPMGTSDKKEKIHKIYILIEEKLRQGNDVAFLTIGDPYIYSTYIQLLQFIKEKNYEVKTIPGIPSFCAAASASDSTLVIGDEILTIMPASKVSQIKDQKYIVIMKVYKKEKEILDILDQRGFSYTYVSRCGRDGEKILRNREDILENCDYMSLIIAHRKE